MSSEHGNSNQDSSSAVLDPTMSLVGRLEDLSLGEILQIVSLSKRSGLLRLESPGGKASLYIRAGKVIYVSSSDETDGVWGILVENDLVQEDQLDSLREKLDPAASPQTFRDLLAESTGIPYEQIQTILKTRVEELTYTLFLWEEGTFSFQLIEDEGSHPQLSRVAPFFLDEGIGAQFLVMEGARRKDEMMRDAPSPDTREKSPMVDPDKVLSDDWEQEFEQHLSGSTGEVEETPSLEDLEDELDEFVVPDSLPQFSDSASGKVVAAGLTASFIVEITGSLVRAGIELLTCENGADALTKIQELRQQGQEPYLLLDVEAPGITDGRVYGGLEIISTMWDFGFHLPVALVCSSEIQEDLKQRLNTVTGLTIFPMADPPEHDTVREIVDLITASVSPSTAAGDPHVEDGAEEAEPAPLVGEPLSTDIPGHLPGTGPPDEARDVLPGEGTKPQEEEYYDIQQEFSDELGDIDLPVDDWEGTHQVPQEASLDPHMARLSSYVNELNRQDISGEITLLALRFASAFANRAILFLVRKDDLKGLGQFGVDLGQDLNADSVVRSLNLPMEEDSPFNRVTRHRQSYKGPPTGSGTEKSLTDALGGGTPSEIYIGPVVSMGKVAVLLYGDDFPQCGGLELTHTLDIFLSHVGLALDRAFLEMKLKSQKS